MFSCCIDNHNINRNKNMVIQHYERPSLIFEVILNQEHVVEPVRFNITFILTLKVLHYVNTNIIIAIR